MFTNSPFTPHYQIVANLIRKSQEPLGMNELAPLLPDLQPEQIQKALENAAFRGLIALVSPGRYLHVPTPGTVQELPLVVAALRSRTSIELAWANLYSPRPGRGRGHKAVAV